MLPLRALASTLALAVAAPLVAGADEPPAAAPTAGATAPSPPATVAASPRARFFLGDWLLQAHLAIGVEPHRDIKCVKGGSATCSVVAFGVGGQVLWRGAIGLGLGLYSSEGSPLVREIDPMLPAEQQLAIGDRISATAALALRPLAWMGWARGDSFSARLMGGLGVEVGPSMEYLRSSGTPLPAPCEIPGTAIKVGMHSAVSLDVPLLGDTRSGWLALRLAGRFLVGPDVDLAPQQGVDDPKCTPQVRMPGSAAQFFAGFSYFL